jgi:hypothetical protein
MFKLRDILLKNKIVIDKSELRRFLCMGVIRLNSVVLELEHFDIVVKPKDFIEIGSKRKLHIQEDGNVHFIK